MPGVTIEVNLPADRSEGTLRVLNSAGQVVLTDIRALGRADRGAAQAHGNQNRDPLHRYGDTPIGGYQVVQIFSTGSGTPYDATMYGPNGAIRLDPVAGEAYTARLNGRTGLLIHSGRDRGPGRGLVPTNGCLRVTNADMRRIIDAIVQGSNNAAQNRCEMISVAVGIGPAGPDEAVDTGDPPPTEPGLPIILP
jgi:hypothetical protein